MKRYEILLKNGGTLRFRVTRQSEALDRYKATKGALSMIQLSVNGAVIKKLV